jgi:hypothetical protein
MKLLDIPRNTFATSLYQSFRQSQPEASATTCHDKDLFVEIKFPESKRRLFGVG